MPPSVDFDTVPIVWPLVAAFGLVHAVSQGNAYSNSRDIPASEPR